MKRRAGIEVIFALGVGLLATSAPALAVRPNVSGFYVGTANEFEAGSGIIDTFDAQLDVNDDGGPVTMTLFAQAFSDTPFHNVVVSDDLSFTALNDNDQAVTGNFSGDQVTLSICQSPPDCGDRIEFSGTRTPHGACCIANGCTFDAQEFCESNGGVYHGDNTSCASANCTGQEIHWINPAGGAFSTDTNWNPQHVPVSDLTHSDTAIFDLPGDSPVVITATNNAVARLVITRMNVALLGPVRALGLANNFSFEVDNAGTLGLGNGVQFFTTKAVVGRQNGTESSVFVSGTNTKWSSTQLNESDQLLIGSAAPGKVVVDHDGLLDSDNDVNVGGTAAGTLRVESGGGVNAVACTLNKGSIQVRGRSATLRSTLNIAEDLRIGGDNGTGSMVIEDGGAVTANGVFVGDDAGTGGETLTITGLNDEGTPSSLDVSGTDAELRVAGDAATKVEVKDGGSLTVSGLTKIGKLLAVGKLLVHGKSSGQNASCDMLGTAKIGSQVVPSEVALEDGGHVLVSGEFDLGPKAGEQGSVSVTGGDTRLTCSNISVGADGIGKMTIADGAAVVTGQNAVVGASVQAIQVLLSNSLDPLPSSGGTGNGSVIIDGSPSSPSEWDVTGDCTIGVDENGTVLLNGVPFLGGARLRVDGTLKNEVHGLIFGNGTLTAPHLMNVGTITPGLSPGRITVEGNFEQVPEGLLKIEIAGLDEGQFDVLNVTGDTSLGGTLEVHMLDGFLLKAGDSVNFLIVGGSITGDFAVIQFPELAPGFDADLTLVNGKLRLTARNNAALGDGTTITRPADLTAPGANCGAGACGAGGASMLPLALIGLGGMRRTRKGRNTRRSDCRFHLPEERPGARSPRGTFRRSLYRALGSFVFWAGLFAPLLVVPRAHAQAQPPRMRLLCGTGSISIDGFECPVQQLRASPFLVC